MNQSIRKNASALYQFSLDIYPYGSVTNALKSDWNADDEDKFVAMLSNRGEMYELNTSAAFLWEALDNYSTPQDLIAYFSEMFEVDAANTQHVVENLVKEFQYLGLVQVAS